jgi:ketosteroid isomerase-like protein
VAERDLDVIEKLEREWRDALCSRDMARLRSLVHPDFVLIGTRSTGPFMMGREEWLEAIQRRDVEQIELEVRDATCLDNLLIGTVQARWRR